MHIGTNYSAIIGLIWFIFGRQVCLHILYILINFQVNILNSSKVIDLFVFLP